MVQKKKTVTHISFVPLAHLQTSSWRVANGKCTQDFRTAGAPIHFNPEGNYSAGFLGSAVPLIDGGEKVTRTKCCELRPSAESGSGPAL